jgi:hypothetical protein
MQERKGCSAFLGRLGKLFSGKKDFQTESGITVELDKEHAKSGNAQQYADVIAQTFATGEGGAFNFNEETGKFEKAK